MYALECGKFSDVINWKVDAANHHCIQIHDKAALSKEVLPLLFKVAKFESFQRKLYRWGFIKHRPSKKKSSAVTFVNPAFRQGDYVNAAKITCSPKKNFRPDHNEILRRDSLGEGGSTITSSLGPSIMRIDDTQPVVRMNNSVQKITPPPSTMPASNISSNDSFASSMPSLYSSPNVLSSMNTMMPLQQNQFMLSQIPTSTIAMNTFMSNANNARNANLLKMSDLAQSMSNPMLNNNVTNSTMQTQTAVQTQPMFTMPDHYQGSSTRHQMIIQNALNALQNDVGSNDGGVQNLNQNIIF